MTDLHNDNDVGVTSAPPRLRLGGTTATLPDGLLLEDINEAVWSAQRRTAAAERSAARDEADELVDGVLGFAREDRSAVQRDAFRAGVEQERMWLRANAQTALMVLLQMLADPRVKRARIRERLLQSLDTVLGNRSTLGGDRG